MTPDFPADTHSVKYTNALSGVLRWVLCLVGFVLAVFVLGRGLLGPSVLDLGTIVLELSSFLWEPWSRVTDIILKATYYSTSFGLSLIPSLMTVGILSVPLLFSRHQSRRVVAIAAALTLCLVFLDPIVPREWISSGDLLFDLVFYWLTIILVDIVRRWLKTDRPLIGLALGAVTLLTAGMLSGYSFWIATSATLILPFLITAGPFTAWLLVTSFSPRVGNRIKEVIWRNL